jgi:hypothetical protein
MCGKKLEAKDVREHFELIRGRAWKIVGAPKPGQASYDEDKKDRGPAGLVEMIPAGARLSRLTKGFPP